jgi:geranylgeranylglycerol-phosphate geranylgeranyltransferase
VLSFGQAIPMMCICICTFIANSLDDVEKDKVNHPERPLPAGDLTPTFAAILYFIFLFSALFLIRSYIPEHISFWYYGLTAASISYGYIVDCLPSLKTTYVALMSSVLPLIVAAWHPGDARLYFVAGAIFLFTLGKETCMDIRDRAGDPTSFMHRFRPIPLAVFAFSLEGVGLLILATQIRRLGDIIDLLAMTSLLGMSSYYWFKFLSYRRAILLMRLQFVLGIYFLV